MSKDEIKKYFTVVVPYGPAPQWTGCDSLMLSVQVEYDPAGKIEVQRVMDEALELLSELGMEAKAIIIGYSNWKKLIVRRDGVHFEDGEEHDGVPIVVLKDTNEVLAVPKGRGLMYINERALHKVI